MRFDVKSKCVIVEFLLNALLMALAPASLKPFHDKSTLRRFSLIPGGFVFQFKTYPSFVFVD